MDWIYTVRRKTAKIGSSSPKEKRAIVSDTGDNTRKKARTGTECLKPESHPAERMSRAAVKSTEPKRIGPSSDWRTSRWRITCPACGHQFVPLTTMLGFQSLTCPGRKCGKELGANYNAEPPIVILYGSDVQPQKKG